MDASTRKALTTRASEALRDILKNGDQEYLLSLSRANLVKVLEDELYFLGLYRTGDSEARAFLHTFLEKHIANWRKALATFGAPVAHAH